MTESGTKHLQRLATGLWSARSRSDTSVRCRTSEKAQTSNDHYDMAHAPNRLPGSPFTNIGTFGRVKSPNWQGFWLARVIRRTWISRAAEGGDRDVRSFEVEHYQA